MAHFSVLFSNPLLRLPWFIVAFLCPYLWHLLFPSPLTPVSRSWEILSWETFYTYAMFLLSPTLFLLLFIFVFSLSQTFCSFRFLFCFLLSLFVLLLSLGGLFTGVLETLYCRVNGCLSALRSGWVAWLAWWLQTKVSTSENSEDWWVRQKTKTRWDCKTPATKQTAAHAAAKPSNSVVRLHK